MRQFSKILRCVATMLLICAPGVVAQQRPAPERLFYMTDAPDAIASFEAHADFVTVIAPQSFRVNARGELEGSVPARVLELARNRNIRVAPSLLPASQVETAMDVVALCVKLASARKLKG